MTIKSFVTLNIFIKFAVFIIIVCRNRLVIILVIRFWEHVYNWLKCAIKVVIDHIFRLCLKYTSNIRASSGYGFSFLEGCSQYERLIITSSRCPETSNYEYVNVTGETTQSDTWRQQVRVLPHPQHLSATDGERQRSSKERNKTPFASKMTRRGTISPHCTEIPVKSQ